MTRRALVVLFLVGLVAATGLKLVWNARYDSEDAPAEVFSASASEAERSGILVSRLTADATSAPKECLVEEAWIEHCAVHRYSWVWLHRRVPAKGFTVVIKLTKPVAATFQLWPPERGASFGWIGGNSFVRHFDHRPEFPMPLVGGEGKDSVEVLTLRNVNPTSGAIPPDRPRSPFKLATP